MYSKRPAVYGVFRIVIDRGTTAADESDGDHFTIGISVICSRMYTIFIGLYTIGIYGMYIITVG